VVLDDLVPADYVFCVIDALSGSALHARGQGEDPGLQRAQRRTRQLAEDQCASEQRQFKAGASSVFLVLQRQNDLISVRLREIRATADGGEEEADFDRATASTLSKQGIDIANTSTSKP